MTYRMIQVGTGGRGRSWCQGILPANIADGLIEVVAAVDTNPEALANARGFLGLPPEKCYTDLQRAFAENDADFCSIVVPPAFHEEVVDAALAHDMHVLSEKPIADTLAASCRIAEKVRRAGRKMGVTMSHRFAQSKRTLHETLRSGGCGAIDYLVLRFTCDTREHGDWGVFRYEMEDPLLIEGAVHHLDILADMGGADCRTIYAQTWNPPWSAYRGDSQALVTMQLENGVRAIYEGAKTNAVGLNGWGREYLRAECERATLIMDHGGIERFDHEGEARSVGVRHGEGEAVPLLEQRKWSDAWLVEKFVRWLDGGEPMETHVEANLQSVAMVFAAIESCRTGGPVEVQPFLAAARARAAAELDG